MQGERKSFVDNRGGNTMAEAIKSAADYYSHRLELSIATGYFDLAGFSAIADVLMQAPAVRILLGTEPDPPRRTRVPLPGEPAEAQRLRELNAATESSLQVDRNLLPFDPETRERISSLCAFLARPGVEVRRFRRGFLHGKAFVFGDEAGALAGSANFTGHGLTQNLELDLGQYGPDQVREVRRWFDDLWSEAEPYDLRALYTAREEEYDPYTIYLRMLLELYGPEVEAEIADRPDTPGAIPLASFQRLGTQRALRILGQYGGVLMADGVGLGKTYMAGDLIRHYVRELGQRAVIIAPAGLRDTVWSQFVAQQALSAEILSFQELATDRQVGDPPEEGEVDHRQARMALEASSYRLVVVDEAHAFRSPDTTYYHALRRLMAAGGVERHLVLLTATPVNNSLWDLYWQLLLFARHDAAFQRLGIPHLREFFKQALTLDLEEEAPMALFPLLDAVAVRRTRHHIQRFYPGETLQTSHGPVPIRFPEPVVQRVDYEADAFGPGFFPHVVAAISGLTMARYWPDQYRRAPVANPSQEVLAGLLQSQLLKRFESSLGAYRATLATLVASHQRFLELLNQGWVATGEGSQEWLRGDLDDSQLAALLEETDPNGLEPAAEYSLADLRSAVEQDLATLHHLREEAEQIRPENDPKLRALVKLLAEIGVASDRDERKVVVFSAYADTIRYCAAHLKALEKPAIANPAQAAAQASFTPYRGRWTWLVGRSSTGEETPESRQQTVWHFVPQSSEAPPGTEDRYDLVLSTDVLAEGQNLQQCGHVVNLDLPWNPMRLVQRNGRVDRIGSPHATVVLSCFFPAADLDALLGLEERLRHKIAHANAAVGTDSPVLPGLAVIARDFGAVRQEIENLARGDAGVVDRAEAQLDAFSGDAYRDELRHALMAERREELEALPWGVGSGMQRPNGSGVVFAARIGREAHWRFVPVGGGHPTADRLQQLQVIRCVPTTKRHLPAATRDRLFEWWEEARRAILADVQRLADPAARQAAVPRAQRDAVTLLHMLDLPGVPDAIRALQVPWPVTVERALRRILRQQAQGVGALDIGSQVLHFIQAEGLRAPADEPPPQPVNLDDIHLVCYQAESE